MTDFFALAPPPQKPRYFGYDFLKATASLPAPSKISTMARFAHYSPPIRRELVRVLYHERIRRKIPMTRLVDSILTDALKNTESWQMMEESPEYQPSVQEES